MFDQKPQDMPPSPRRIIDTEPIARPFAAWLAGLATAMLALGCFGALHPLLPPPLETLAATDDSVQVSDFQPADEAPPAAHTINQTPETAPPPDLEIPPVPEITLPMNPPEVPELLPLNTPLPMPSQVKPPEPNPRPEPKSMVHRATPSAPASKSTGSGSGSSDTPTLFSGGGAGSFPKGTYPAIARSMRQQGTVRLQVTVEASGLPSSVEVQTSSGFGTLDSGALDQVRRHWRWPAGPVRHYLVPFHFELH